MDLSDRQAPDEFRFLPGDAARVGRSAALPEVDRVSLDTASGAVSALRFDPSAAPRIVTLHGAGLNAHSFDPFMLALDVPGVSIDLPGHGRSDWRDDADYAPAAIAPAVAEALQQLVDPKSPVVLLGHSLGGLTAAIVAALLPEYVARLVIVDITPGISPSNDASSVLEFITGQRSYETLDEIVDRAIAFGIGHDRAALTRGVALNTRVRSDGRLEWTHHFAHLDALPSGGSTDPLPYAPLWQAIETAEAGETPVSLVRAESGMVGAELAAEWRDRFPRSEVVSVAGPHNLHEAAPVELAEAIRLLLR